MGEQEEKLSGQDVALVTCPRCNGTGKSPMQYFKSDELMPCRYCRGQGVVEPKYALSKLEQEVVDAIGEGVPITVMCPRCEYEIDSDQIINTWDRGDIPEWKSLAQRIIEKVKKHEPRKIVMIQAEYSENRRIAEALSKIPDDLSDYFFFILPLDTKILTKSDIINLLKEAGERL